jgi:predicted short-subunit dehydrogenase-like oxidoreductase (DUF2520 family)
MKAIQSVGIYGFGNLGSHLTSRLIELNYRNIKVFTSKKYDLPHGTIAIDNVSEFASCDLVFCAVPDSIVASTLLEVASFAPAVSVSGTVSILNLNTTHAIGTLYPLVSFVKNKSLKWEELPIFIHTTDTILQKQLLDLATQLSGNGILMNEEQRMKLHLAAVFANNFTTHLYDIAAHWCEKNQLDFGWLKPLIQQNCASLMEHHPHELQTGPAKRNDQPTINKHLQLLQQSDLVELYELLTASIQTHFSKQS